jgi:hypothetical protein
LALLSPAARMIPSTISSRFILMTLALERGCLWPDLTVDGPPVSNLPDEGS